MNKTYILVNSGYGRKTGHTTEQHDAFVAKSTALFRSIGWKVLPSPNKQKYPTVVNGKNRLYLHHFFFVGEVAEDMISVILNAFAKAKTFGIYAIEHGDSVKRDYCFPST